MSTAEEEARLAFLARGKASASLECGGPPSPLQAPCWKPAEGGREAKHHCRSICCEK